MLEQERGANPGIPRRRNGHMQNEYAFHRLGKSACRADEIGQPEGTFLDRRS
jgi:hypothetical protein